MRNKIVNHGGRYSLGPMTLANYLKFYQKTKVCYHIDMLLPLARDPKIGAQLLGD